MFVRRSSVLLLLGLLGASMAHAQDLASTCHASSSYDVTLKPASVLFDRPAPAPFHVELQQGMLRSDGSAVNLNAENQDRLAVFERQLRELAPRVRTVARNGVDIVVQALRNEADGMGLSAATHAEFLHRLDLHAAELKRRISVSQSTHDWQGDAANQAFGQIAGDLLPLLAADLSQQAIGAALSGDLQTAATLRDRAADLATSLQPRLQARLQVLRPQIEALCPAINRLAALQQGVRGSDGQLLNLVQVDH